MAKPKTVNDMLGLFGESDTPTVQTAYAAYQRGIDFNNQINLDDTVRSNQNFAIGKQWEGVQANGLPMPVLNFLKRVVGFTVSTITTDNVKVNVTPLANTPNTKDLVDPARIVTEEISAINEINDLPSLVREFARNAAIDGDGCIYSYWDASVDCGNGVKGAVKDEIIDNTRVFFGNPNDRDVQSQPYIIIITREPVRTVRKRAKNNQSDDWNVIVPDVDDSNATDAAKYVDDKVTVINTFYKNDEGTVWCFESTKNAVVHKPHSLKIRRYPICWLCWDIVKDCYHGQAMITGLIPNQIFVNKFAALTQVNAMRNTFSKVIFDKSRIKAWDNRVGGAIGVNGGDINNAAKILDPPLIDPQVSQLIKFFIETSEQSLGATAVALGDTRPDNTSAILSLQKAAATPSETTKLNLYKAVEDHSKIQLEYMAFYYGKRKVDMATPEQLQEAYQFAMQPAPNEVAMDFDFGKLQSMPMMLKLDVGASSYFSEIASIQTLSNLLMQDKIDTVDFLERMPDEYIPARRALIESIKGKMQMAQQQQAAMQPQGTPEIEGGGGYGSVQRAINAGQNPRDFVKQTEKPAV